MLKGFVPTVFGSERINIVFSLGKDSSHCIFFFFLQSKAKVEKHQILTKDINEISEGSLQSSGSQTPCV